MQIVDILILKKKDSMRDRIAYVFNKQLPMNGFLPLVVDDIDGR